MRMSGRWVSAALAAVSVVVFTAAEVHPAERVPRRAENQPMIFKNSASGNCMDRDESNMVVLAKCAKDSLSQQWIPSDPDAQLGRTLKNKDNGLCLTAVQGKPVSLQKCGEEFAVVQSFIDTNNLSTGATYLLRLNDVRYLVEDTKQKPSVVDVAFIPGHGLWTQATPS
ncbi:hypothetical protein [Embleya sp. NPDC059259]|uniref:hypothetical protein n=1 Tax=unclassified Embleya TaxID=2699296 RepID=UPI003680E7B1